MNNLPNHNLNALQSMLNLSNMESIANSMDEMLSKFVLECLIYTILNISPDFSTKQIINSSSSQGLTLNQLALQRRSNLLVPKARYPDSCSSPKAEDNRIRLESMSTSREEASPFVTDHLEMSPLSLSKPSPIGSQRRQKRKSRHQQKIDKTVLTFDNETGELATRCDVVYKTILRDFRRFFLDEYKIKKQQGQNGRDLGASLMSFTETLFPRKSEAECKAISIDLGCLLFPKEIIKNAEILREIERTNHFGVETCENKIFEIMRIHGFLYKFSIDKIEECFENNSLCELFLFYVTQTREDRISSNPTMNKNGQIYLKARDILEEKAAKGLAD